MILSCWTVDGNMSVQKKFVQKEFNFGLQERLTGTVMPVEDNDFRAELYQSSSSDMKCVSSRSSHASELATGRHFVCVFVNPGFVE